MDNQNSSFLETRCLPAPRQNLDLRRLVVTAGAPDNKTGLRRTYSTHRALPIVQISEAALNRARSLRVPSKKRAAYDGFSSANQIMNSPPYPELSQRSHRAPSAGARSRGNMQRYRQATIASTSTNIPNASISSRPSPNMGYRNEYRHLSRSGRALDKPEPRVRRQLPSTAMLHGSRTNSEEAFEMESVTLAMDDFDYFCSISHSPNSKVAPVYAQETTQSRRQRLKGMKSHSMLHPNESLTDHIPSTSSVSTASMVNQDHYVVDKRMLGRTLTTYNADAMEDFTSKRLSGNASRNNSSVSLTQSSLTSHSPGRVPITPQAPPHLPLMSKESPLGAAISQEALDADDPDLVEFKVQVVGSPSVGKTTICQRLASLNGNDYNDDTDDDFQQFSVRATLNGKIFNVGLTRTAIYTDGDAMNMEIQECVDAFVVVYAIDAYSTFDFAKRVLQVLRESIKENSLPPAGFILVGNKSDLVRGREVPTEEGNQFAQSQKAKFIEVSAVLDHKIPELLLTIITHLRELEEAKAQRPKRPPTNEMWATSRKIAVKVASGSGGAAGSNSAGESAASTFGGRPTLMPEPTVGGAGEGLSRSSKRQSKREIVKFFKRHFSRSIVDDSYGGRETGNSD